MVFNVAIRDILGNLRFRGILGNLRFRDILGNLRFRGFVVRFILSDLKRNVFYFISLFQTQLCKSGIFV